MNFGMLDCLHFSVFVALLVDFISTVSKTQERKVGEEGDGSFNNRNLNTTTVNFLSREHKPDPEVSNETAKSSSSIHT